MENIENIENVPESTKSVESVENIDNIDNIDNIQKSLKNAYVLSKKEEEVMRLLWHENRELSSSDIIQLSPNKTWKASSIFILLNSLLKKGAIEMAGFIKSQTNYGRTFKYVTTENEYMVMQIKKVFQKSNITTLDVITELIKEEENIEAISIIENILNNKKSYLENLKNS